MKILLVEIYLICHKLGDSQVFLNSEKPFSSILAFVNMANEEMVGCCAVDWEADSMLRNRGREHKRLTVWPSKETIGIPSNKPCALNARTLEVLAQWWCTNNPTQPMVVPVNTCREKACCRQKHQYQKFLGESTMLHLKYSKYTANSLFKQFNRVLPIFFSLVQVLKWRALMGFSADIGDINLDSWGLKRMLTHQIRRWMSGASNPRVTWVMFSLLCGEHLKANNPIPKYKQTYLRT